MNRRTGHRNKGDSRGFLGVAPRPFALDYPQPTPLRPMRPEREAAAMRGHKPKGDGTALTALNTGDWQGKAARKLVGEATEHANRLRISETNPFYDTAQRWLDDYQTRHPGRYTTEVYAKAKEMIDLLRVLADL